MERFGILGHRPHGPNGEHLLVLWNGDHAFVEPGTPHDEICARHGLDRVEPGPRIRVCTAVCVDGPLAGKTNPYVKPKIGIRTRFSGWHYELVELPDGDEPGKLRFVS